MITNALSLETEQKLRRLNDDFCYFLDHSKIEKLVNLFTENATYKHAQRISSGRSQIRQLFAHRQNKSVRTSRHLQTGLRITMLDEFHARGQSVCMTFAANSLPPISPAEPYLVADFTDRYELGKDGIWRIGERTIERIFTAINNHHPVGTD